MKPPPAEESQGPEAALAPLSKVGQVLHGLGEIGAFFARGALAVLEVCLGRWPRAVSGRRRKGAPPDEDMTTLDDD